MVIVSFSTRLLLAAQLALLAGFSVLPASAQGIVVVVNRDIVTEFDVLNRQKLLQLTGGGKAAPPRAAVVEELIDERLKLYEAKKLKINVTDAQVDTAFASIAERAKLTPANLVKGLAGRGVAAKTLRDRLRGDIAWQQVVQQRGQLAINIRDQDVIDALKKRGEDPDHIKVYEYVMAQVVFFNQGSNGDRKTQAEAFRTSVNGCDTLREKARNIANVAVKEAIRRTGTEMPTNIRELIEKTPVGHATAAQQSPLGTEFIVVCDKKEVPGRDAATQQVRSQLVEAEQEQAARRLLTAARQAASIDYRNK